MEIKKISRALRRSGGNIKGAANALKIPYGELKALIDENLELQTNAFEAEERALDKAEAALIKAMRTAADPRKRMAAAGHIARTSSRWRK